MQTAPPQVNEAFTMLMREHHGSLRTYIRSLGVDSAWVDDLAQEAFLVAHRRFADFDERTGSFGSWLRGIARRLVANELRKTARRTRLVHEAVAQSLLNTPVPELEESRAAIGRALRVCLEGLPERSRELLRERYERSQDSPALGLRWGWSAATTRKTLLRLRLALRQCVERRLATEA